MDGQGRVFLTYVRPARGIDQIVLAESADGGRTWRSAQITDEAEPARLPSLAVFPDGALHLVWTEYAPVGRIYYRMRRAGRWGPSQGLSVPGVYAGVPVVAPAGTQPHVLWYGILPERPQVPTRHGSIYEILATAQEATRWRRPEVISPGPPDSINPSLGGAGGRLHAAWYQFDGQRYQIRYARYAGRWTAPLWLTRGTTEHTRVALEVEGTAVHLVWVAHGPRREIIYQRLGSSSLALAAGQVRDPVAAAAGGRVAAAWAADGQVYARSVVPLGPTRLVGTGGAPMIVIRRGVPLVAWTTTGTPAEVRIAAVPLW